MTAIVYDGDAHFGREGRSPHGVVTPTRDDQNRRSTDASKLTFPLQMVIVIVGGILATVGAFWVATSSLRSDVRDILTRMELQTQTESERLKLQDERISDFRNALEEEKRQRTLQKYDIETRLKELEQRKR